MGGLTQRPAFRQVWVGEKRGFCGFFSPKTRFQVSVEGLEPSTNGLKGHCSAIELYTHSALHSITPVVWRQMKN